MTLGFGGFFGLIGMALVAWFADSTPKAPEWLVAPKLNIPAEPPPQLIVSGTTKNQSIERDEDCHIGGNP
jgi:hypothetical protein